MRSRSLISSAVLTVVVLAALAVVGFASSKTSTVRHQGAEGTRSHVPAVRQSISYSLVWTRRLDANADSTPVVGVRPAGHLHVVFVLAGNNGNDCDPSHPVSPATLYAFSETTGKAQWHRSTTGAARCTTAAPATSGSWVYAPGLDGYLHRYAIATGKEFRGHGWPEQFTKQPNVEKESSNLVVSGHDLYATTSGFIGDAGHYEGHVVTVNLKTGHNNVWNSLCSSIRRLITGNQGSSTYCPDVQAGMFGRGQAAIDPLDKDVYVVTGNGPWNGRTDWGDSVLKLNTEGSKLLDAFTPTNQAFLNSNDLDLGSTGPAILPPVDSDGKTWHLLVQGGKGGASAHGGPKVLWLVNRDRMGPKPGPGHLGGQLQDVRSPGGCEILTAPAVWHDASGRPTVIYGNDCGLTAYVVVTGATMEPRLKILWTVSNGTTTPVISGGMLFVARNGEVNVYNPETGKELWSSSGSSKTIGNVHWEYPAVDGRWLFVTDENARLYGFKLK